MVVLGSIALTHVVILLRLPVSIQLAIDHLCIVVRVCISTVLIDAVILDEVVPRIGEARIILHVVCVLATDVG